MYQKTPRGIIACCDRCHRTRSCRQIDLVYRQPWLCRTCWQVMGFHEAESVRQQFESIDYNPDGTITYLCITSIES